MPPKSKRDREELKREWAAIPEFPSLKEAELHISDAVRAMGSKNIKMPLNASSRRRSWAAPVATGAWRSCMTRANTA